MVIQEYLICIIVVLIALRTFKVQEAAITYWLCINAIMLTFAYEATFSWPSMHYVVPLLSNVVLAFLISNAKELSKPAYFLLVGTVLAAIVNMFSAVAVLFYQAGIIHYPASVHQGLMVVPLVTMILGFIKLGHGHYKRIDDGFDHVGLNWALHRFAYQKTAQLSWQT